MVSIFMLSLGILDVLGSLLAIVSMKITATQPIAIFLLLLIILKGLWTIVTSWL